MKKIKQVLPKLLLYMLRWQMSTLILAPMIAVFKHSPNVWGTLEDWLAAIVSNIVGSLVFFWVDMFIFKSKLKNPLWEVKEGVSCADCHKTCRGYRLVQTPSGYNRLDSFPEFRCEECSIIKWNKMNV